jgi:hypothetical protein
MAPKAKHPWDIIVPEYDRRDKAGKHALAKQYHMSIGMLRTGVYEWKKKHHDGAQPPADQAPEPEEPTLSAVMAPAVDEVESGFPPEPIWEPLPDGWAPVIQPFEDLKEGVERALIASIRRFGILYPVVRDQYGRTLDGHQRIRLGAQLDVPYQTMVRHVTSDEEAHEIAQTLNAERRHLSEEQRRLVAYDLRMEGMSYRSIGEALDVSHTQARHDVEAAASQEQADTNGQVESRFPPETIVGKDRKRQPAKKPIPGVERREVDDVGADQKRRKADRYDVDQAAKSILAAFSDLLSHCATRELIKIPEALLDALDAQYDTALERILEPPHEPG